MRFSAQLICLAAFLVSAPAFAQAKDGGGASATSQSLASRSEGQLSAESPRFNLGLGFNKGTEETLLPLAPIEKDQLELSWKPGGKWGITLDLTSRSDNDILPREELAAGAYYQVTPRFRFGGGVTVKGDSLSSPGTNFKEEVREAAVRIESAFSF
jgi:NtrZ